MENLRGKKILLLGSTPIMEDVIRKAREMGIYTIDTDRNNPDAFPVKKYADEYWMTSYAEVDEIVDRVRRDHIDGVYTQFNDSALPFCQQICERLGFPFFLDAEQLYTITNKRASKNMCIKYGIPVSKEYHITDKFLEDDIKRINWPVLTKPTDNSGQRGISICHNLDELKKGFAFARENSKEGQVIVEEYMQGDYVVLNFTIQNGNLYLSCMADKPVVDEAYSNGKIRLPKGYVMPSKYIDLFYEKEFERFQALAKGIGLRDGNWGVECVVRNNDFYVFEMQFRLGGMRHYTFVQEENGIDILKMHLRYALTGKFEGYDLSKLETPYFKKCCCLLNLVLNSGTVTKLTGMEILDRIPEVQSYVFWRKLGDRIELSGSVFQIFMKASIVAKNHEELIRILNTIQENIVVEDEHGNNMLLRIVD